MTTEELNKKVERLRLIKEDKLKNLLNHSKLLDQAFDELKEVIENELDLIYQKIDELDKRLCKKLHPHSDDQAFHTYLNIL